MSQVQIDGLHQLSLGADPFKECDQLQLEEHYRVDRWAANFRIERTHKRMDVTEIQVLFQLTIEIILGDQVF